MGERKGFASRKRTALWKFFVVMVALTMSGCEIDPSTRRHLNNLWILALIAFLANLLLLLVSSIRLGLLLKENDEEAYDEQDRHVFSVCGGFFMFLCFVVFFFIHSASKDAWHASPQFELKEGERTACVVLIIIFATCCICFGCYAASQLASYQMGQTSRLMWSYKWGQFERWGTHGYDSRTGANTRDWCEVAWLFVWVLVQGALVVLGPAIWLGSSIELTTTSTSTTSTTTTTAPISTSTSTTSTTTTTAPPWTLGIHPAISVPVAGMSFLVPMIMWSYLCVSTKKYPGAITLELILVAGDFSSDLLLALLGQFYHWSLCAVLLIATLAPGTTELLWTFCRGGFHSPPLISALVDMFVRKPIDILSEKKCNPVFQDLRGSPEKFLANMAVLALLGLWIPFGLVIALIVCIFWPCALFALGVVLQSTRLLLFGQIFKRYAKLCGKDDTFILERCTDSKDENIDFLPAAYHRSVISELMTEAIPSIGINIVNSVLLDRNWSFESIFALLLSVFLTWRLAFKYSYWLAWHGKKLDEIPVQLFGETVFDWMGLNGETQESQH